MLKAGTILNGRYEIQSVAGEGGMGAVYLALDGHLGRRKVAVKEMAVNARRAEEKAKAVEQFREEARLLASLEHPRLVPVTDFFELDGNAYLVMAFVEGQTLATVAAQRGMALGEVVDWVDQVGQILEYLHEHEPPVLFRDLKPSNVMLDDRRQIRLIDFGIARTLEVGQNTRTFLKGAGTAEFAPVEQFGGRGTDVRSDIYSLGATMYNLMTGELPPIAIDVMTGESAPANPRAVHPDIPPMLEAVIVKAMALRKEERYSSVRDMRADLARVSPTQLTAFARRATPRGPRGRVVDFGSGGPASRPPLAPPSPVTECASHPGSGAPLPTTRAPYPMPPRHGIDSVKKLIGLSLIAAIAMVLGVLGLARLSDSPAAVPASPVAESRSPVAAAPVPQKSAAAATAQPKANVGLPVLEVDSKPKGAHVTVDESMVMDGENPDATPLRVSLKPGNYQVQVVAPGYETFTTHVRIRKGQHRELFARLVPAVSQAPANPLGSMPRPHPTYSRPPGY